MPECRERVELGVPSSIPMAKSYLRSEAAAGSLRLTASRSAFWQLTYCSLLVGIYRRYWRDYAEEK